MHQRVKGCQHWEQVADRQRNHIYIYIFTVGDGGSAQCKCQQQEVRASHDGVATPSLFGDEAKMI